MKYKWLNQYECEKCDCQWEDVWDCQVDDDCPECHTNTSPYESEEVDD